MKRISTFPSIDIRALGRKLPDNPILHSGNFFSYASGRAAIFSMAQAISNGQKRTAYLPVFHCGVEVEAFLRAGFRVKFYRVQGNLQVNLADASNLDFVPGDLFFVIHYFGFPQPIDEIATFCSERKLSLVEDCAHGLYSKNGERLLGSYGDWAIFSMRKSLALPNGGGLLRNGPLLPTPASAEECPEWPLVKSTIRSILVHEVCLKSKLSIPAGLVLRAHSRFADAPNPVTVGKIFSTDVFPLSFYDDARFAYGLNMSRVSRLLLQPKPVAEIVNRRRANYQILCQCLNHLSNLEPVFPELSSGVCPLCFPVWVDSSDYWMVELENRGVEGFVFGRHHHPSVSDEDARDAERMRTSILGLPIHQDLNKGDIEELAQRIEEVSTQKECSEQ